MGRVYKALAKNWKEQASQPERQEPVKPSAPNPLASNPSAPIAEVEPPRWQPLHDEWHKELRDDDVVYGLGLAEQPSVADFGNPAMPVNFNVEDEIPMLRDAAVNRESTVNDWSYEPRRLQVA